MDWINIAPSAPWQWIGIIVGFAAFGLAAMALPTVLQMFFGRPSISIEFHKSDRDEGRVLHCYIFNRPIRNRLLRVLGVSRQSTKITTSISIYEKGTHKILREQARLLINHGIEKSTEIGEVTSAWPVIVAPIAKKKDAPAFLNDDFGKIDIPPGYYTAELDVFCENKQIVTKKRGFHVSEKVSELFWESD